MPKIIIAGASKIENDILNTLFGIFGEVKSIVRHNERIIVDYSLVDDALRAIDRLKGKEMKNGSKISASMFYNIKKRVVVRNEYNSEDIKCILSNYGKIYNVETDPLNIFIDFFSEEDAARVLDKKILSPDGTTYLKISRPLPGIVDSNQTIIIYNKPECKDSLILRKFRRFGEIVSYSFDKTKAFINYSEPSSALKAYNSMNNKILKNKKIVVCLKAPRRT